MASAAVHHEETLPCSVMCRGCTTLNVAAAAAAAVEDQSSCASVCGTLDSAQISLEHIRLCVLVTITT
jgi:hypothetical protein